VSRSEKYTNGNAIMRKQPIAVMRRRPNTSDRWPRSGISNIDTSAWSMTKLRSRPRLKPSTCVP
jgi:hypothetical protein